MIIHVLRKPLTGTVTANVLAHGTGALNIDGCRIGTDGGSTQPSGMGRYNARLAEQGYRPGAYQKGKPAAPQPSGRWPSNILLDEWHERVLVLTDNEHEQRFREFFSNHDSVRDLWSPPAHPAVAAHAGAVLQSSMLRAVALREQARGAAPHVREESLGGFDREDGGVVEGQREVRPGLGSVEGRQVQEQGVHNGIGFAPDWCGGRHRKADDCEGEGLCPGASACRGLADGETIAEDGGRSPSERQKVGQQAGELGANGREGTQAGSCLGCGGASAGVGDNRRPALRVAESDVPLMWREYFSDSGLTIRRGSAAKLDEQVPNAGGGYGISGGSPDGNGIYSGSFPRGDRSVVGYGDGGGASRFFQKVDL